MADIFEAGAVRPRRAMVTITIGSQYKQMFERHCAPNWKQYCDRFGYDLIVIDEPLDRSERAEKRSPAWQKLLILSQDWSQKYERIVWVDADVLINNQNALDVCDGVPMDRVGAVEAYSIPTREIHDIALRRLYQFWKENGINYVDNSTPGSYYAERGIPGGDLDHVVQTGVFVCSPKYHRDIFERIYHSYEEEGGAAGNYEMPAMSYELVRACMVTWISPRFNYCVMNLLAAFYPEALGIGTGRSMGGPLGTCLKKMGLGSSSQRKALENIHDLSMFVHFAGCAGLMDMVRDHS